MTMVVATVEAQVSQKASPKNAYSYGTCATTVLAPFGAAFIVDSRITKKERDGNIVDQFEGCKVRLLRPTILIAAVGLEDAPGVAGLWNSLDQAVEALKTLPENPTEQQLNEWGTQWGNSLLHHFRDGGETPPPGEKVAETLLITKIGNEPYYRRTTVTYDGSKFGLLIAGQ